MANLYPRRNKNNEITSYTIRVYRGRDRNGKQLKPYTSKYIPNPKWSEEKNAKEAQKAAILFEKQCLNGLAIDTRKTFGQYAQYVIELKENIEKKKHTTIKLYKKLLERIEPAIGYIKLGDLRPQHLNNFYAQLSQPGMNLITGGYLSSKTILEHHRFIHVVLEQAEKEMLIPFNVASKATPPKYIKKEIRCYQIDEVRRIRRYLKFEPLKWQIAIFLLIYTGGRRGEVCGLRIKDINFKESTIHFQNNLLYSPERGIYEDTLKTSSSDRIIQVSPKFMQIIKAYSKILKQNIKIFGTKWNDTDYLLTQENGNPMHPDSLTSYCTKFTDKYNKIIKEKNKTRKKSIKPLPHLNPHAFRHSHLTILLSNGVDPLVASKRGGHSRPTTTFDMYGHFLKKADEKAAAIFDSILK